MTKLIRPLSLILISSVILSAHCRSLPSPHPETPQETLQVFKEALNEKDYRKAYQCFSENTKSRYREDHFKMMFKRTIFGGLIHIMVVNWKIVNVEYSRDGQRARLTFQHWKYWVLC